MSKVFLYGVGGGKNKSDLPQLNKLTFARNKETVNITNPSTNGNFVSKYRIYNSGTLLKETTSTSLTLTSLGKGDYELTATAVGNNFKESEPTSAIKVSVYSISQGLTNLTSSNTATLISSTLTWTTTLTPSTGYYLPETLTVYMGGQVCDFDYNTSTGKLTIENVNGDITLTAIASDTKPTTSPIYGVSWTNDATTTMTRTDDAVSMTYAIQSSDGSISSDFNDVFPWNETVITELSAGKFLKMPEMYFRIGTDTNGDINSVAVSQSPSDEGNWYKVDSFYYACYGASANGSALQSKTGTTRLYSTTRANFRTKAQATGDGYQQLDLYHKTVMNFLWWIEWATKDSSTIMTGKTSATGSSQVNTGGTDSVSTPSGFNTSTQQMRYHYIEDFVGNYMEFYDGISGATNNKVYVSANASKYSDTVGADGYSQVSYTTSGSGWIYSFGWDNNNAFLCYPRLTNSSTQGGFSDYCYALSSSYPVMYGGAHWNNSSANYGLCYCNNNSVSNANNNISARLIYLQIMKIRAYLSLPLGKKQLGTGTV